jgi:hypothetical protein
MSKRRSSKRMAAFLILAFLGRCPHVPPSIVVVMDGHTHYSVFVPGVGGQHSA